MPEITEEDPDEAQILEQLDWRPIVKTINPARPRCAEAAYAEGRLYLSFARPSKGASENIYVYENVTPQQWAAFWRVNSPGRYVNRVLNSKSYHRIDTD